LFFKNHAGYGKIFITKRHELLRSYCNGALWHFANLRNFTKDSVFIIKIANKPDHAINLDNLKFLLYK